MEAIQFLCGNFRNTNFVYAIRSDLSDWYYFDEDDSYLHVHVSLPPNLANEICRLDKVKPISVNLNDDQIVDYVNDGIFVFKGKELKTFIELSGRTAKQRDQCHSAKKLKSKSTDDLVFEAGKTNPAIFLEEFEKCHDVKTEKDKLYKLRNFVKENDKAMFSTLFFQNDWQRARSKFLERYSMEFTQNKKKALCFSFESEAGLRSFVERKMNAMASYTTLPTENQLEVILSELPNEVANIFIVENKLKCTKAEILEFCDVIQEGCDSTDTESSTTVTGADSQSSIVQELEIFTFQEGIESSDTASTSTNSSGRVGRGKVKRSNRSGRPAKIPRTISEETFTDGESDSS